MNVGQIVSARAYASIANFGYGFDSFGAAVTAGFDVVTVGPGTAGITIESLGAGAENIPLEVERNTAGLAVRCLMNDCGVDRPTHLTITKGVRHGSGMGSSAASAAAAVTAANAFFGLNLDRERLVAYAAEGERAAASAAHADNVAAAIFGGFTICTPKPPFHVVSVDAPSALRFVIALPDITVPTSVARGGMPEKVELATYSDGAARCGAIVAALSRGDLRAFGEAVEGSFVDACRAPLIPGFERVRDNAKDAGAAGVVISGAGPAVAAVASEYDDLESIAAAMRDGFTQAGVSSDTHISGLAQGARVIETDA